MLRITIGAILLSVLTGCVADTQVKGYGAARWPAIPIPARLEYTPEEKDVLNKIAKDYPVLTLKITTQMKVMRIGLETYDKLRWKHNAEGLRTQGYTEAEIVQFLGPDPNKQDTGANDNGLEPGKR